MAHRSRLTITLAGATAAFALLVSSAQAGQDESRQAPPQQEQQEPQQQQDVQTTRGTLQDVDIDAKTVAVRTADGADVTIMYTDQTSVTGASGGVAGLGEMSGREVVVQSMMKGADRVASSIQIQPEQ
jgi:hypothetical protein